MAAPCYNNQEDHCGDFFDNRCWVGIPEHNQEGVAGSHGCDIGCYPCMDNPPGGDGMADVVFESGRRWMRRHATLPSRDARGTQFDLRSNVPRRVPERVALEYAACWDNFGGECFDSDYCPRCFPWPPTAVSEDCPSGELVRGANGDAFLYRGHRHSANDIGCRHISEHGNLTADVRADSNMQAILLRFGADQHRPCYPNRMIPCAGRIPGSDCPDGAGNLPNNPEYYNGGPHDRGIFDPLHITWQGISLRNDTDVVFPWRDRAVIDAKNAVLDYVRDNELPGVQPNQSVRFDRLDYSYMSDGGGGIDVWRRTYNTPDVGDPLPCDVLPEVPALTWSNCYLQNAGVGVTARVVIVSVDMYTSLVPIAMIQDQMANNSPERIRVSARTYLKIRTTLRATLNEPSDTIEVVNHPDGACHLPPYVDGDEIVYVDNDGRILTPSNLTEWRGYLGEFSSPTWEARELDADQFPGCDNFGGGNLRNACFLMAAIMSDTTIPAWPTMVRRRPDDPMQVYAGSLNVAFNWELYCSGGTP